MPGTAISNPLEGAALVVAEPVFSEPVFSEPWQAEAFALAVSLSERGLFAWSEWAQRLGAALKERQVHADVAQGLCAEEAYWRAWVAALESLLAERAGLVDAAIAARAAAWQRAAEATPHGSPILLENDPQRGARPLTE